MYVQRDATLTLQVPSYAAGLALHVQSFRAVLENVFPKGILPPSLPPPAKRSPEELAQDKINERELVGWLENVWPSKRKEE